MRTNEREKIINKEIVESNQNFNYDTNKTMRKISIRQIQ